MTLHVRFVYASVGKRYPVQDGEFTQDGHAVLAITEDGFTVIGNCRWICRDCWAASASHPHMSESEYRKSLLEIKAPSIHLAMHPDMALPSSGGRTSAWKLVHHLEEELRRKGVDVVVSET